MMERFSTGLSLLAADLETVLANRLNLVSDPAPPRRLLEAMRYAVLGGGKRFRAFLTVETARLLGGERGAALHVGAAIECIHAYSLVHDDLPAMDDDDLRRGKPTLHRAFDEATAILAGDALQALAFEILADPVSLPDAAIRVELVRLLARAAGMAGMVGGQIYDLQAEGRFSGQREIPDAASVRCLQAMKTGALIACAVDSGAVMAGADPRQRADLIVYGKALGAAFQICDDILDVEASPASLGKASGKDAGRGKGTLIETLGLEAARDELGQVSQAAIAALAGFGEEAESLREAARFAAGRRQ